MSQTLEDLTTHCTRLVLEHLLTGKLKDGVAAAIEAALYWNASEKAPKTENANHYTFTAEAKNVMVGQEKLVSAWTDGLSLSCDTDHGCAYRLKRGKTYRVTVCEVVTK
jgi:hypothetical protein